MKQVSMSHDYSLFWDRLTHPDLYSIQGTFVYYCAHLVSLTVCPVLMFCMIKCFVKSHKKPEKQKREKKTKTFFFTPIQFSQ